MSARALIGMERELRMVPLCDLKQQYQSLQTEIDAAMQKVAASGHYVLGPEVKAFEQEMACLLYTSPSPRDS